MSSLTAFGSAPTGYPPTAPPATKASIRSALALALKSDAGVTAAVGSNVFPLIVPESASFPALTYQIVQTARERGLGGPTGIADAKVQFTAHSRNLAECDAAIEAVRQVLDGLGGATFDDGTSLISILGCTLDDERDTANPPTDGSDRGVLMSSIDYTIRYREPRPRGL